MVAEHAGREALKQVMDPELKRSLVDLNMVRDVRVSEEGVRVTLALTTLGCPMKQRIVQDAKDAVSALPGVASVEVDLTAMTRILSLMTVCQRPGAPLGSAASASRAINRSSGRTALRIFFIVSLP